MEKPLTLPCFIESLPRPLKIQPAYSEFSAQPSPGYHSPRIFFFFDRLILTVAVDQDFVEYPYPLLEMSYLVDESALITTKAELKFPVTETLSPAAPYTGLSFNDNISQCSFCHRAYSGQPRHCRLIGCIKKTTVVLPKKNLTAAPCYRASLIMGNSSLIHFPWARQPFSTINECYHQISNAIRDSRCPFASRSNSKKMPIRPR
jgi:hypothetical protein